MTIANLHRERLHHEPAGRGRSRREFLSGAGSFAFAAALAGPARAAMAPDDKFDLVIKNADVLDPSQSLRGRRDIGIRYGSIEAVDTSLLRLLIEKGYVPVLTPPAVAREGDAINVDGDKLAMEVAVALGAESLLIFSNTPGLLADLNDPGSTVHRIDPEHPEAGLERAQGRMKKKVLAAVDAVKRGVGEVILADANAENAIEAALAGAGTRVGGRAHVAG